jgi:hypothetical protein
MVAVPARHPPGVDMGLTEETVADTGCFGDLPGCSVRRFRL